MDENATSIDATDCANFSETNIKVAKNFAQHDESILTEPERVDTPAAGEESGSLGFDCSEDETSLTARFDVIHTEYVQEKRNFDYLVNRLDKRFSRLEGQKNKAQNETGELLFSVKNLLRKVNDMENNLVADDSSTSDPKIARGPPLPSQSDMFMLAYQKGQVSTSYSKFNQRQWSAQKTSYKTTY